MQLYCPSCQQTFAGRDHCPTCHTRMVTAGEVFSHTQTLPPLPIAALPPTGLERFVLGTLIALGLYLSLHEWSSAVFKSVQESFNWDGPLGGIVSIILQVIGVVRWQRSRRHESKAWHGPRCKHRAGLQCLVSRVGICV